MFTWCEPQGGWGGRDNTLVDGMSGTTMTEDSPTGSGPDDESNSDSESVTDGDRPDESPEQEGERVERNEERDGQPDESDTRDGHDGRPDRGSASNESAESEPSPAGSAAPPRPTDREPDVSVTIEGTYDSVFERLEHPQALQHSELDTIAANIESTLLAVLRSGGGIRSEIYDAVDFELDEPWAIRIYLEVLEMHDLIRLRDDRWVPSDSPERADRDEESS